MSSTDADDLTEQRKLLALCPPGHPERPRNLIIAGTRFFSSFLQTGAFAALNEATRYSREVVSLRSLSPSFESAAYNLCGGCLIYQFKLHGHILDLDEGILCHRRLLSLHPEGHANRVLTLNALGESFIPALRETPQDGGPGYGPSLQPRRPDMSCTGSGGCIDCARTCRGEQLPPLRASGPGPLTLLMR
ncbi:hypothetical protein C8R46DRAFT_360702 [Mycena filopes]|nr:hypothetical protein C8R46DRAFT_360702 [Mycena filopes]